MKLLVFLLLLFFIFIQSDPICDLTQRSVDCGYGGISPQDCLDKGCCWNPVNPNPQNLPWCFYKNQPITYNLNNIQNTSYGFLAHLIPSSSTTATATNITLNITLEANNRIHLKFTDSNKVRWEIPESILPTPGFDSVIDNPTYSISWTQQPATFTITRKSDNKVLSTISQLIVNDTWVSIKVSLDQQSGPNVYGLGEHTNPFKLNTNNHAYTLWTIDVATPLDTNLYGSHPFFLELHKDGTAHGVFLRNSNGMDVVVNPDNVMYNSVGGIIDLYLVTGPTPNQVVQQYHQIIGKPTLPAYWALGWHQCRYGYTSLNMTKEVVANYSKAGIPLETIWNDIDYMDAYEDWSWDPTRFPVNDVANFVKQLHTNNQHYVVITDAGIHVRQGYPAYDNGLKDGIFLMNADNKTPFVGQVWPGPTTFPDFLNPATQAWWNDNFESFLNTVPIDGIWLDMNEISNFGNGVCSNTTAVHGTILLPTYTINNYNSFDTLNTKTTGMDCLHYGNVLEYNTHNMFGFLETRATNHMLVAHYNKRPFILSRSTFAGSGHWGAHWLGDNQSTWQSLIESIAGLLGMNLFGVPFVGADICGFIGDTNEELCARWSAVGAFYPFSRNHNGGSQPQEPYQWPSVTQVAIKTLNARYSILPYVYTFFYLASINGGQVAQALLFNFPNDANTYAIDQQFMLGNGILVTPVLTQGATSVKGYFPDANWYDFWTGAKLSNNGYVTLQAALTDIPVHVLGGVIIPMQEPANTIAQTRSNPFKLTVPLDRNGNANGMLYLDDGESVNATQFSYITYTAKNGTLQSSISSSLYSVTPLLQTINILGVTTSVSSVTVNGGTHAFTYNSTSLVLGISSVALPMLKGFTVSWK